MSLMGDEKEVQQQEIQGKGRKSVG